MLGVLVECDPKKPGVHGRPIYYEGIPGKYGRFEHPRTVFEEIEIMEKFEHEMIRRYGERRVPATFLPPVKPKNTEIKDVIFNNPATIVLWKDGTKTVVKCQEGDTYSKELGLAMCISKKYLGNKGNFNEVFKKWIPDETPYTEEELSQLLQNIDFSKIGEALGDILYNFGKSLIEIYGPTPEPTAENQEPEEDLDIEPIEPEPEDITNEGLTKALYSYCGSTPCKDCKIPKDEKGNCESILDMGREELINTYKAIKK